MIGRVVVVAYVAAVATIATIGFTTGSTAAIVLAGLLALPSSVPAVIGLYLAVALLSMVPGANSDSSSGSACSTPTACEGSSTGDPAAWVTITTDVVGVLALAVAAVLNVLVVRAWIRGSASASARTRSGA